MNLLYDNFSVEMFGLMVLLDMSERLLELASRVFIAGRSFPASTESEL